MMSMNWFEPEAALAHIEKRRAEHLFPAVPPLTLGLLRTESYDPSRLGFVRTVLNVAPADTQRVIEGLLPETTVLLTGAMWHRPGPMRDTSHRPDPVRSGPAARTMWHFRRGPAPRAGAAPLPGPDTQDPAPPVRRRAGARPPRRPGRPGEGIRGPRPPVPVLPPAGPGEPGVVLSYS
jgi:hypothetical protein